MPVGVLFTAAALDGAEETLRFGLEGVVFLALGRVEVEFVDVFGEFGEAEVDEFHFLLAAQADGGHERLEEQAGVDVAGFEWSDQHAVEDVESFETSCQAEESHERVQIAKGVDDGGSGEDPSGLSDEVVRCQGGLGLWVPDGVAFIEYDASPINRIQPRRPWHCRRILRILSEILRGERSIRCDDNVVGLKLLGLHHLLT